MQINEVSADGLSREYSVTIAAADIAARIESRLQEMGKTARLAGFRPGKAPLPVLRRRFGDSVKGEVLQKLIEESGREVLQSRQLRPVIQPELSIENYEDGGDLVLKLNVECAPEIPEVDFKKLQLTRHKAKITDGDVDADLEKLLASFPKFEAVAKARQSREGDVLVIDTTAVSDGEPFPAGVVENHEMELGGGRMIPGFEDAMIGAKPGESRSFDLTLPPPPQAEDAGEQAAEKIVTFTVVVKELRERVAQQADDAFAKSLGLENLQALKGWLRERLESDCGRISRNILKRALLDSLHETVRIDIPARLEKQEFDSIWESLQKAREAGELEEDDANKSEEELEREYRDIARRRIALALLLADIGRRGNVQVSEAELKNAVARHSASMGLGGEAMRRYWKDQRMLEAVRDGLFEDKVVDYVLEMATIADHEVSMEELQKLADRDGKPDADAAESDADKGDAATGSGKKGGKKRAAKPRAAKSGDGEKD